MVSLEVERAVNGPNAGCAGAMVSTILAEAKAYYCGIALRDNV
jgi:hypothetical protein